MSALITDKAIGQCLQAYLVIAGDGVRYDTTNKCYVPTSTFVRQYA